jgi:hypothetical protein
MTVSPLFNLAIFAVIVWMLYMMTFRTDDWLRLTKDGKERNERIMKGLGHAAKGSFWLFRLFMKK